MVGPYECKVYNSIAKLEDIREVWNKLALQMQEGESCHSFEWYECWYSAYCQDGNEIIIVLYERDCLRAIFPGMLAEINVCGVPCKVFSCAGNGHSPRCGILAEPGDIGAIKAVISFVSSRSMETTFDFSVMCGVLACTDTHKAINDLSSDLKIHVEHCYDSAACDLQVGWEKYYSNRSKSVKNNVNNNMNRAKRLGGEPILEIVRADANVDEVLERLSIIEGTTWQCKNGTGLFSKENKKFYEAIIRSHLPKGSIIISFLTIAGHDAAYNLFLVNSGKVFSIKIGYDPKFAKCSPGLLTKYFSIKYFAENDNQEFDITGENNEAKMIWATHYLNHFNYWIFNSRSLKGNLISNALKLNAIVKNVFARSDEAKDISH